MGSMADALRFLLKKKVFLYLRTHALVDKSVILCQPSQISLGDGAKINNYCVLKPNEGSIKIGRRVIIGEHCVFYGNNGIEIGDFSLIAPQASIMAAGHHIVQKGELYFNHPKKGTNGIKIGKNVWIGANATILDNVSIGDNSIVAAGSVVTKSIPANTIAMGCPAKQAKSLS